MFALNWLVASLTVTIASKREGPFSIESSVIMPREYAITRQTTEFFGPLRCRACIDRDSKCFVNQESRSCFHCSSEVECLFTRMVQVTQIKQKTNLKRNFTWEEMNNQHAPQIFSRIDQNMPQFEGDVQDSEEHFAPNDEFHPPDEPHDLDFPEEDYNPYLMDNIVESSSSANWLPHPTTAGEGYGSTSINDAIQYDAPLPYHATDARDSGDNAVFDDM